MRAPGLPQAQDILLDARADERPSTMELGVQVVAEKRDFSGDSFGLALAVADKLARFGRTYPGRRIYATGAIARGGRGMLAPVAGFDAKAVGILDHVAAYQIQDAIFLFAQDNLPQLSEQTRALLDAAYEDSGLECMPLMRLSDCSRLWRQPIWRSPQTRRGFRFAVATGIAGAILLAAAAFAFWPRPQVVAVAPTTADDCIDEGSNTQIAGPIAVRSPSEQGEFGLDAWLNGRAAVYAVGEVMTLHFSVTRPAYVQVFDLDRMGRATRLFPDAHQAGALLSPGEKAGFAMKAAGPAGVEMLKVIATSDPPDGGARPDPEFAAAPGQWQERAICLKITS
ncbi:MAG: DUF4384 domain-containing protein [Rhizomicrobium sp.]